MANPDDTKIDREGATVGTVNYMSPESICGDNNGDLKQGRASDVWSLGCILYQMVHGATPFSHLRNLVQKMQAITNEGVQIKFPPLRNPHLDEVIRACLQRGKPHCWEPVCARATGEAAIRINHYGHAPLTEQNHTYIGAGEKLVDDRWAASLAQF